MQSLAFGDQYESCLLLKDLVVEGIPECNGGGYA